MSAVFTVSALFGCGGSRKYTVDDIIAFHTSCCGMESNPVYAFALRKQDENWLFSASCMVKSREDCYTSFSSFPIPTEEAEKFLEIIREEDEIRRLRKYRNPIRFFHIADEPMRSSGNDLHRRETALKKRPELCDRAVDCLRDLADRYYEAAEKAEPPEDVDGITDRSVYFTDFSLAGAGEGSTDPLPVPDELNCCLYGLAGVKLLTEVNISRGCMDHSSSYSFSLEKTEDNWFLSFDCAADCVGYHTNAEKIPVDTEEAEEILRTVRERRLISDVLSYEAPSESDVYVLDETTYNTSFAFSDGSSVHAPISAGRELTDAFYSLAGRKIKK